MRDINITILLLCEQELILNHVHSIKPYSRMHVIDPVLFHACHQHHTLAIVWPRAHTPPCTYIASSPYSRMHGIYPEWRQNIVCVASISHSCIPQCVSPSRILNPRNSQCLAGHKHVSWSSHHHTLSCTAGASTAGGGPSPPVDVCHNVRYPCQIPEIRAYKVY